MTKETRVAIVDEDELDNVIDQLYNQVRTLKVNNPDQLLHYYKEALKTHLKGKYFDGNNRVEKETKKD